MPELPDITVYVERLREIAQGQPLDGIRLANPFLLRTVEPTLTTAGRNRRRVPHGKRIVLSSSQHYAVIHLMIADACIGVPAAG